MFPRWFLRLLQKEPASETVIYTWVNESPAPGPMGVGRSLAHGHFIVPAQAVKTGFIKREDVIIRVEINGIPEYLFKEVMVSTLTVDPITAKLVSGHIKAISEHSQTPGRIAIFYPRLIRTEQTINGGFWKGEWRRTL